MYALQAKDEELAKLRGSLEAECKITATTQLDEERSSSSSSNVSAADFVRKEAAAAQHAQAKSKELEKGLARVQASLEACQAREASLKQQLEQARAQEKSLGDVCALLEQRLAGVEHELAAAQRQAAEAAGERSAASFLAMESRMQVLSGMAAVEALTEEGEQLVESAWVILEAARTRAAANTAARADACRALGMLSAAHAGEGRIRNDPCAPGKEFVLTRRMQRCRELCRAI